MRGCKVLTVLVLLGLFASCTPGLSNTLAPAPASSPVASVTAETPAPAASPTAAPTLAATGSPTRLPLPRPTLDQFIITMWTPPDLTQANLEQVAEGGFNLVSGNLIAPAHGKKVLDMAQALGLRVMVTDPVIAAYRTTLEEDLRALTDAYKGHPALWGYYIIDEPGASQFADLARLNTLLLTDDPQHFPYINLFPNYAVAGQLGTADYAGYVRTFIETVQPAILSYDHYALLPGGVDRPGYFANLDIIRAEALRAGIPFMQIILATPFPGVRDPSAADLRYQVYTTLAYGAKGISYFTYAVPPDSQFGEGLLDRRGQRTAKWYSAQAINQEVQQLGKWLLHLESKVVYFSPSAPEIGGRVVDETTRVAQAAGGKLLFGEFLDGDGGSWLMVVNLDRANPARVVLTLRGGVTGVQEVNRVSGELAPLACTAQDCHTLPAGYQVTLELAAADGRLFKLD